MTSRNHPRVVIVGGGFGGLAAARGLRRADVELTVVDRANHHLFQPLLYQVASAALSPGDIAHPIREILGRQRNTTVIMGEVRHLRPDARTLVLAGGATLPYDTLLLAVGARHTYFDHPEWEARAPGLKTLRDALQIRERILLSYERAERALSLHSAGGGDARREAEPFLTFVVVGAGPTGVEMAGAIAEIAHRTMLRNFRRIDPTWARVFLVEAADEVLPTFSPELRRRARRQLEALEINVLTGTPVQDVTAGGVALAHRTIASANVIWAAGNQASPLLSDLETSLDRQGRALVEPDLTLPGHPEIFVLGDAAHCPDTDGEALPALAPVAIQQGQYVARVVRRNLPAGRRPPFRYHDRGSLATIGRAKAVGTIWGLSLSGLPAWLAWSLIHIFFLIGFRNRVRVMLEWVFWYFTGQRSARLIQRPAGEEEAS